MDKAWSEGFIALMVFLQVCASFSYFIFGDWRRGLYWLLAGCISVVVSL